MFIIYDMILAALLCGVVMYLHPGWYELCLENFAKLLQLLDIPIDCYDVYCRASEVKNVYSKRVLASAAIVVSNTIIAFWYVIYRVIRCFQVNSGEDFLMNWGIAILTSLISIVVLVISDALFYLACRKFCST